MELRAAERAVTAVIRRSSRPGSGTRGDERAAAGPDVAHEVERADAPRNAAPMLGRERAGRPGAGRRLRPGGRLGGGGAASSTGRRPGPRIVDGRPAAARYCGALRRVRCSWRGPRCLQVGWVSSHRSAKPFRTDGSWRGRARGAAVKRRLIRRDPTAAGRRRARVELVRRQPRPPSPPSPRQEVVDGSRPAGRPGRFCFCSSGSLAPVRPSASTHRRSRPPRPSRGRRRRWSSLGGPDRRRVGVRRVRRDRERRARRRRPDRPRARLRDRRPAAR